MQERIVKEGMCRIHEKELGEKKRREFEESMREEN